MGLELDVFVNIIKLIFFNNCVWSFVIDCDLVFLE